MGLEEVIVIELRTKVDVAMTICKSKKLYKLASRRFPTHRSRVKIVSSSCRSGQAPPEQPQLRELVWLESAPGRTRGRRER